MDVQEEHGARRPRVSPDAASITAGLVFMAMGLIYLLCSDTHFASFARLPVAPAPRLGQHTDEVLSSVLAMPDGEIARLHDRDLIAS